MPGDSFEFDFPTDTPLRRAAVLAARPLLPWILHLRALRALYDSAKMRLPPVSDGAPQASAFASAVLGALGVRAYADADDADPIPRRGPLIVAANHPLGALDGLVVLDLIGRVRPDVRLVANHLLASVPELRDFCFFVDPFDRRHSTERSLAGLRAAHLWLRRGGALIIFPAGEVAHLRRADGAVVDSRWHCTLGRLALRTNARILPASIFGANGRLFYLAGRIHPLLRTVLLPREFLNHRGGSVRIRLGRTVSPNELPAGERTADAVTQHVRQVVENTRPGPPTREHAPEYGERLAQIATADLADDILRLPADSKLITAGDFDVYCAEAGQIPHILAEIGVLRERAFRAVGEGTGRLSDLDSFDEHYRHLFIWHRKTGEVVGAYRLGCTDRIVASTGIGGLYTRTLFRFDEALLNRLPPALELGRSFVRPEYQRDHSALLLLWRGICAWIQRHPRYRALFGAVSISRRYTDRTRHMLMRFLEQNHLDQRLAEVVSSLQPYSPVHPGPGLPAVMPRTIEGVDALISRFENDGRGMPVLLRQYLKLNARVLGFNVDPSFGDVLDALMMVDLLEVEPRILRRYFGSAGACAFLEYHSKTQFPTPNSQNPTPDSQTDRLDAAG